MTTIAEQRQEPRPARCVRQTCARKCAFAAKSSKEGRKEGRKEGSHPRLGEGLKQAVLYGQKALHHTEVVAVAIELRDA